MRIALIVEGATEKAFLPVLRDFLRLRLSLMPKLQALPQQGRIPKGDQLRRLVRTALTNGPAHFDAVIALTDVYTGANDFDDATDAKRKMRNWVGGESRFYPHASQFDFEAWLLPYWDRIQELSGSRKTRPGGSNPESVNHQAPPAQRLNEIFLQGSKRRAYVKTRDAVRILQGQDLMVAINACPELKAFVNTILRLSGGTEIA